MGSGDRTPSRPSRLNQLAGARPLDLDDKGRAHLDAREIGLDFLNFHLRFSMTPRTCRQ